MGLLGLIAVLAALVVVVVGVVYAGHGGPGAVDVWVQTRVDGVGAPWLHVARATDFLGEPVGAVLLVGGAVAGCLLLRRPRAAVLLVVGVGLSVGATRAVKPLAGRTIHDGNLAYPSGHTAFLTAFALVAALLAASRLRLGTAAGTSLVLGAALVAGGTMGWAQVALGSHYPTDTLGGLCTALALVPAAARLVDRTADRTAGRMAGRRAERAARRTADTRQSEYR
ncbi:MULTISPECIES: phosphatase PAP2 family protein [Streptomyces]|uniref:Phosphatase PAP2 family protein n=1 Tax=Streptomyces lienomycini TaxID=284035 RepID=A0ABV9WQD7_9ACTN|nr:phosphatase PAP2 family protein [Streptomyces lienomycini]